MKALVVLVLAVLLSGCQAGMAANPQAAGLNVELGAAYLAQGRLELARDKLIRATDQDSGSSKAHRVLGMVYERLGETSSAEEHYQRAVRLAPGDVDALNSLGVFRCRRSGEEGQGLRLLRRAAREASLDRRADVYANCGLCELPQDRAGAAVWFRLALQLDPDHRQARDILERLETRD